MRLVFHPLVQADLRAVLEYYEEEGGVLLAARFFAELDLLIEQIAQQPRKFHLLSGDVHRANMMHFPYHLLFRETATGVRVLVLRHHKRHPQTGLGRQ